LFYSIALQSLRDSIDVTIGWSSAALIMGGYG
jgi:hypothetical protein